MTETSREAINRMTKVLMEAWIKSAPRHSVTRYPTCYVATFVDMARAALDAAPQAAVVMRDRAAKALARRIDEIAKENGSWEPDTNEVNLPEWAETACEELEEIEKVVRALPTEFTEAEFLAAALALPEMRALWGAAKSVNHDSLHGNGLEGFRKNRDRLRIVIDQIEAALVQP
jgi:hypothetical protein